MSLFSFGKKSIAEIGAEKNPTEADLERLFEEATTRGAVLCSVYFDSHGPDKQIAQNSLIDLLAKLPREKGVLYSKGEIEEPIEENGVFSFHAHVKVLFADYATVVRMAFSYGPVSIEVLKPSKITLDAGAAQTIAVEAAGAASHYANYFLQRSLSDEHQKVLNEKVKRRAEFAEKLKGAKSEEKK